MFKPPTAKFLSKALLLVLLLILTLLTAKGAFGATTSSKKNSLGTVSYQDNPYMYLVADRILDASNVEGNLNLRLHPMWTYMLFDQQIIFCGLPVDKLKGATLPAVITYERQAHHSVEGVGCHEILKVDSIQVNKEVNQ